MLTSDVANEAQSLLEEGIAAARTGDKEAARDAIRHSTEIDPGNEAAWLWLSSLYTELPVVAFCLQQALSINPTNTEVAKALATVNRKMIEARVRPATNAATDDPPVSAQLAQDAPQEPSPEAAAEEAEPEFSYEEIKRRGIVAAKGGRREEARQYLVMATERNDADAETWYWLSTVVEDLDDKQIALENVLIIDPLDAAAQAALDETLHQIERRNSGLLPDAGPVGHAPDVSENSGGALAVAAVAVAAPFDVQAEAQPGTQIGAQSKLFAPPVASSVQVAQPQPSNAQDESRAKVVGGKYRVLSVAPDSAGVEFVACEVSKHQYVNLRTFKGDVSDLKRMGANYVTDNGKLFQILPIDTGGLSLRSFIAIVGTLPPDIVAYYGLEMLKTLAELHEKGPILAARKLVSPDTVALDRAGQIVLEPEGEQFARRPPDALLYPFLPTEQAQRGSLAPTSDLFAVAALMFFMLTGAPPPAPDHIPRRAGDSIIPDHFAEYPSLPADLARVVAIALQPSPEDRFNSASEMASALRSTDAAREIKTPMSLRPIIFGGFAILVLLLGFGVITGKLPIWNMYPFGANSNQQILYLPPTPVPAAQSTQVPVNPLARTIVNSVDVRRFPSNYLYFSALDPNGLPIDGLSADSMKLKENGNPITPNRLVQLSRTTDPVSVIIALDTSDRMAGRALDDAKTAVHILVDRLQPGDQMALVTYGSGGEATFNYTVAKAEFLANVDSQKAQGPPDLPDAVTAAAGLVRSQQQAGYTMLVVLTNGGLPKNSATMNQMVIDATSSNLPVFIIGQEKANFTPQQAQQLANATGGVSMTALTPDAGGAGEAIKIIEKQLHNAYKLSYDAPPGDSKAPRMLDLSVTARGSTHTDQRTYQIWSR